MAGTSLDDEDLISSLPDEIITNILSFVPTKSAVATSVLSKRWNQLWISVPNLDFGNYKCPRCAGFQLRGGFVKFISRVLKINNVLSVRKICLQICYCYPIKYSRLRVWLSSIAKRDAEEIDLRIPNWISNCYLPTSFFNQINLVELKLAFCLAKIPQSACFPSLKSLHLELVVLIDGDDSMQNLMSACPVIRNLYIEIFYCDEEQTLCICSSTLHTLDLRTKPTYGCNGYSCDHDYNSYNVVIDVPNLTDLFVQDHYYMASYEIINVSSLETLYSSVSDYRLISEVLRNLPIPMLHNLTDLTVRVMPQNQWEIDDQWEMLPRLLQSTPNLVTFGLILDDDFTYCPWDYPNEVPHCFSSCLESFGISMFLPERDEKEEIEMISYILKNASGLKELRVYGYTPDLVKENTFIKTLLALPRSSDACRVYYESVDRSFLKDEI